MLFIYWIRRNRKELIAQKKRVEWIEFTKGGFLSGFPFLSGLILVFNLDFLFDLNPPEAYIGLLQFLLFILVSYFIFKHWPKQEKLYWIKISIAFILFLTINNIFHPGTGVRLVLLGINIFLAFHAMYFVRQGTVGLQLTGFTKRVSYIFLILNIIAIIFNSTGRVILAKMFSNAAIAGFIQIIALSVFTSITKTAFLLQAHTASTVKHGRSLIDYTKLNNSISRFLSVIVVVLWIIAFASNMNVYNALLEGLSTFLFKSRVVGTTTFTIGNILLFFFVLYLSTLAQKYVDYILGENTEPASPGERKGSIGKIYFYNRTEETIPVQAPY